MDTGGSTPNASADRKIILSCRCCGDRTHNVLDMVDRVRYTGILGYALVCEINLAFCVKGYVLKQCVSLDRVVDIRLESLSRLITFLASTLEVEYAVVVPAVLVITDEETLRVGRKWSFRYRTDRRR